MEKVIWFLAIVVVLFCLLVAAIIAIYNTIVRLKLQKENAWSQISVQLKRRHDLIPNLVETVKGYSAHEATTLENVIKARQAAIDVMNKDTKTIAKSENNLTTALKSVFAVAENYPDLKANQSFLSLQEELSSTENRISFARQFYNDAVMYYNECIQVFPNSIIAGFFNFKSAEFFEIDEMEKENVKVQF